MSKVERLGMHHLVEVATCSAFRLTSQSLHGTAVLMIITGRKPSACHQVDILPVPGKTSAYAAIARVGLSDLCLPGEQEFKYSEEVVVPPSAESITVLSRGSDPSTPKVWDVAVEDLEPNSLQRLSGSVRPPNLYWPGQHSFVVDPSQVRDDRFRSQASSFRIGEGQDSDPYDPRPYPRPNNPGPQVLRDSGNFKCEMKFWVATYGGCEVILERESQRWIFRGQGGGVSGGGGFSGHMGTNSLEKLVRETTSCTLAGFPFYGNGQFFGTSGHLGSFDGVGWGGGGGAFTGSWTGPMPV